MLLVLVLPGIVFAVCPSCQQQCPCTTQKTENAQMPCIGFDTRYMAATIDEAMFTFPNLVSQQGKPLFDKSNETTTVQASKSFIASSPIHSQASVQEEPAKTRFPSTQSSCVTQECMSCKLAIINGFLENSPKKDTDPLWASKYHLEQETGQSTGSCGDNNTPMTTQKPQSRKQHKRKTEEVLRTLKEFSRSKRAIPSDPSSITNGTKAPLSNSTQTDFIDALLGVTTQIGCDYRRGSSLSTNTQFSGLCNLCWQWRRLPEQYFPNYVNEVSCDTSDCGCLSGFGQCMPVTRSLDILKNTGSKTNPKWEQVTIDTIAACECRVAMSSPLLSFVAK